MPEQGVVLGCPMRFTIQNVPIKYCHYPAKLYFFLHLQYKMFLLNGKEKRLWKFRNPFTIQNVPIK